jgi:uncharacterized LabA/DUF88 family protein
VSKAYAYVDGWNFYHGINKPELHALGFVNLWRLCQHLLFNRSTVTRVYYFTATDYHTQKLERQQFWWDALESVGVQVAEPGFFGRERKEKTTDVRLALKIAEDVSSAAEEFDTVLLISADADFIPALEKAKRCRKEIRVAFPPGHNSEELKRFHQFAQPITKDDLEQSVFDGEGRTKKNVPLTKALDYGWACRVKGTIQYGRGGSQT